MLRTSRAMRQLMATREATEISSSRHFMKFHGRVHSAGETAVPGIPSGNMTERSVA